MRCLYWLIPLILAVVFLVWNMFLHINKTVRLDMLERQLDNRTRSVDQVQAQVLRLERDLSNTKEILRRVLLVDVATRWEVYNPIVWGQEGLPYIIMEKRPTPVPEPIPVKKEKKS